MAIRKIAKMGHPVLHQVAAPVDDPTDPEIARLAADMQDTLEDIGGSGIAAPQIYVGLRVVVFRLGRRLLAEDSPIKPRSWTVMVNPKVTPLTEETVMGWERCLSLPGLHGKVPRYAKIRIAYRDLDGAEVGYEADGAFATLLQHECDHLDGVLYPMRMPDLALLAFNDEPGQLAKEIDQSADVWPLFHKLVDDWPGRERWTG